MIKWIKSLIEYIKSRIRYKKIIHNIKEIEYKIKGKTKDTINWKKELSNKKGLTLNDYNKYKLLIQNFKIKCVICNKIIGQGINSFKCSYCKLYHCNKHRLPEKHKCPNKLNSLDGSFREIHEDGKITALGR